MRISDGRSKSSTGLEVSKQQPTSPATRETQARAAQPRSVTQDGFTPAPASRSQPAPAAQPPQPPPAADHAPWLEALYQAELGRPATPEELQRGGELIQKSVAEGHSLSQAQDVVRFCVGVTPEWKSHNADKVRAQVVAWAVAQANAPNVGYSKEGRFGNRTDANGNRFYDCSGLLYSAYKQFGVELGGDWTGAMRATWPNWADQVPKDLDAMRPGDLVLVEGHVVMYTGNGRCVGAQTSNAAFKDQVRANIDVNAYLRQGDCIVLRPRI